MILTGVRMSAPTRKHPARIAYLVAQILGTCKDLQSRRFYARVAQVLPDEMVFRFLSEIRQDDGIRSRGAVFTSKVKRYLERHVGYDNIN